VEIVEQIINIGDAGGEGASGGAQDGKHSPWYLMPPLFHGCARLEAMLQRPMRF
jgi:hypothetical protein